MIPIALPFGGNEIEYGLPLVSWPAPLQFAAFAVVVGIGFTAAAWLYRTEMNRTAKPVALALLGVRWTLILVTLVLVFFDPRWVGAKRERVPGRILIALDTSESMAVTDLERGDTLPRIELGHRIARQLAEDLRKRHTVDLVGFHRALEPLGTITATGTASDLNLPLVRAGELASDQPSRLAGIVLLSDGRHNLGPSPKGLAQELGARNIPVFPVVLAPDAPPVDLSIVETQALASTVFQGTILPVDITVRANRWPPGPIHVALESTANPGRTPIEGTIQHPGGDATHRITLRMKIDQAGPQSLAVTARSSAADDRVPGNNRRTIRVNAVKERARVLMIDGEARWEFHYLHTALGRDPNMEVRSVVFRQPRITPATDEDVRKFGIPSRRLPAEADSLFSYDCIILGDVEPDQLGMAERERLEQFVAEAGGTLVVSAGKRAMPLAYSKDEHDPIRRLLPIRNPQAWSEKLGFRLVPGAEFGSSGFLQLAGGKAESQRLWEQFPPHFWAVTGEPKPAAEVLASADGRPVIVRQNYGFGRVLYLGIDSTWRWRYRVGDRYHHTFWGQTAQWAATDRLLPTSNPAGTIRFGTREPSFKPNQPVEIVVRSTEAIPPLPASTLKGARILERTAEGLKPAASVPLSLAEGHPSEMRGTARDLPPGRYRIELEIPAWAEHLWDGAGQKLGSNFEVLPFDGEEMLELSANRGLMQELADASGGRMFEPSQVRELADLLLAQSRDSELRKTIPLRSSWWAFLGIVFLLGCEWGLRKWAGLP
jgi:hypothetical protein